MKNDLSKLLKEIGLGGGSMEDMGYYRHENDLPKYKKELFKCISTFIKVYNRTDNKPEVTTVLEQLFKRIKKLK